MSEGNWMLWQLLDTAFPAGGFAHSAGLEATMKHGEVTDLAALDTYIDTSLHQAGRGSLPFVLAAYDRPDDFARIDAQQDAILTSHVANRASRAQGRGWLTATVASFPEADLTTMDTCCQTHSSPGHFAPVFGGTFRALQQTRSQTAEAFLFVSLRGVISAGIRLGITGPLEGQRLTAKYGTLAQRIAEDNRDLSPEDAAQTAPIIELYQAGQDRLYSRLFQS